MALLADDLDEVLCEALGFVVVGEELYAYSFSIVNVAN